MVAAAALRPDVPRPSGVRRRREIPGQLLGIVAEAARRHHDRAGGQRVLADADTHDGAVLREQAAHPPSEGDLDSGGTAAAGEHVYHGLASPDRAVDARQGLITAEYQLVVVLHPEITEPFHRRPRQFGQPLDHGRLDLPLVELHVVVKQRSRVIHDAERALIARTSAHHQPAGQARRAPDHPLGLSNQHALRAAFPRGQRRGQTRRARSHHQDIDVPLTTHRCDLLRSHVLQHMLYYNRCT